MPPSKLQCALSTSYGKASFRHFLLHLLEQFIYADFPIAPLISHMSHTLKKNFATILTWIIAVCWPCSFKVKVTRTEGWYCESPIFLSYGPDYYTTFWLRKLYKVYPFQYLLAPVFLESLPLDVLQYVKDRRKLTDDEKHSILRIKKHSILRIEKHRASVDFQYPKTNGRRFNPQWEEKFHWLRYSPSVDGCFCTCCLVFAPESTRNIELISMLFRDWKNEVGSQRGTLANMPILIFTEMPLQRQNNF